MSEKERNRWQRFDRYPLSSETVREYVEKYSRSVSLSGKPLLYLLAKALIWLFGKMSWHASYRVGEWLGIAMALLGCRKKIALANLDIVYGKGKSRREKEIIYRASLVNFGRVIINHMRLPYQNEDFWKKNCTFHNRELLDDSLRKGKGLIVVGAHLGMMDLAGGKIGMAGYPVAVVAKKMKHPVLDKIVVDARKSMNLGTIAHRGSIRRIISGLRRGEAIVLVIDQNMKRSDSIFINWMGHIASAMPSSAYLARHTGAPVVTGFLKQTGACRFELHFIDTIPFVSYEKDEKKELLLNTQLQADAVQKMIYQNPELWFWIHRRYKIQPKGQKYPY